MTRPMLIVIGPSASGKSTVVRELARRGVLRVHPTWTTRPRRADEQEGEIEHRFVDDATFARLDECGFFLGTVRLAGLPYRYGLPSPAVREGGPVDTVMARAPFVDLFAPHFPNRVVFQIEDTPDRARLRLLDRACSATEVDARLGFYIAEAQAGRAVADRVFCNDGPLDALIDAFANALHERVAA